MKKIYILFFLACLTYSQSNQVLGVTGQDTFSIHTLGHGSLYLEYQNLVIQVDPYSAQADYTKLPDADILLITHGHQDHYDLTAIKAIKKESTIAVLTQEVKSLGTYTDTSIVMKNGDSAVVNGIPIKAVPAYNVTNTSYHPKGTGNGYVLTFGGKRVYIAGDTEKIPEMESMGTIDIAFLPMNLPYTMTPAMAAEAAKKIKPRILYIYHFGNSDTALLRRLLSGEKMEIRMKNSVYNESTVRKPEEPEMLKNSQNDKISFYPNPVKGSILIMEPNKNSVLSISDMSGRIVLKQFINVEKEAVVNLNFLKTGNYILNLSNKSMSSSVMILKE
jgi:L-ascorbate metabolism protein UlaG (beta-lactamase superfamily)